VSVITHGCPGQTAAAAGAEQYGRGRSRRGAWFEGVTARALERWLTDRAEPAHLFHDLTGFCGVEGNDLPPVSLGNANIDHVILTGVGWIMVNAKGCGAGTLGTDQQGRGILSQPGGTVKRQGWLDSRESYSHAGVLVRLTGLRGYPVWLVPDATDTSDPSLPGARCLRLGGAILTTAELLGGRLLEYPGAAEILSGFGPADPANIAALARHVSTLRMSPPAAPVSYPWQA
jgi:hypothetical protein